MAPVIDGQFVAASPGQSVLQAARAANNAHPHPLPPGGAPPPPAPAALPGGGPGHLPPASRLPHPGQPRHGGPHHVTARRRASADGPRPALLRAQSHLLGVRPNGHCELQTWRRRLGVTHVALPYHYPRLGVDISHPVTRRPQPMRACSRCVRVCDEIEGAHIWDIAARGIHLRLVTELARPWVERRLHLLRQVRAGPAPPGALAKGTRRRGDAPAPPGGYRRLRDAGSPVSKPRLATVLARWLHRVSHVAARRGRGDGCGAAQGRRRLRPPGRHAGVAGGGRRGPGRGGGQHPRDLRAAPDRAASAHQAPRLARRLRRHQQRALHAEGLPMRQASWRGVYVEDAGASTGVLVRWGPRPAAQARGSTTWSRWTCTCRAARRRRRHPHGASELLAGRVPTSAEPRFGRGKRVGQPGRRHNHAEDHNPPRLADRGPRRDHDAPRRRGPGLGTRCT